MNALYRNSVWAYAGLTIWAGVTLQAVALTIIAFRGK